VLVLLLLSGGLPGLHSIASCSYSMLFLIIPAHPPTPPTTITSVLFAEFILHHESFILKKTLAEEDSLLSFTLPIAEPLPPQYFIRVVSDRWLGCEATLPVSFRRLLLPDKFPPPTELLDLQPLPVTALRNPDFEGLYKGRVAVFNPIQTQGFTALYTTDDNVLLCAPTGSGKTIAAEFAVLRMVQKAADGKGAARAVYVAPVEAVAAERYQDWSRTFGDGLGLNVVRLTGEPVADLKLLERGNVVVATAEHWDMLSRRWRQRKAVQQVSVFIADEMHLIGGEGGPTLEVVVSRMRYISSQLDKPIRIVGLAASVANARDLGEWIGASGHGLFAFPPGVRPVPLEIHVQGFDVLNLEARMEAMARPAYAAVCAHARDGAPAIVFVPTRRHARAAALDVLTRAAAEGTPQRFLHASEADVEPHLEKVADPALRHSLTYGVAFLHEGQAAADAEAAKLLFDSGACQVLVAAAPCAWGMPSAARAVVIMGTQYYDVTGQGTNDYAVADLLQMMGRAGRPDVDDAGT
jgi:pre-mRNA-splicing helicase BRR2